MQNRGGVFEFARLADNRCLAVTLRVARFDAERIDAPLAEQRAQFLAGLDQCVKLRFEAARIRVVDYRDRHRTACRRIDVLTHFNACFVHLHD